MQSPSETSHSTIQTLLIQNMDDSYGAYSIPGNKVKNKPNEDIFDCKIVANIPENLTEEMAAEVMRSSFKEVAEKCQKNQQGSTFVTALLHTNAKKEKILTVGSLGDSSVFLVLCDNNNEVVTCKLINEHHLYENPNEMKRVLLLGGHSVAPNRASSSTYRLNKALQVLRSLGDKKETKEDSRLSLPDIVQVKIPASVEGKKIEKAYVILTSDGFTDVSKYIRNDLENCMTQVFKEHLIANKPLPQAAKESCEAVVNTIKITSKSPDQKKFDDTTNVIIPSDDKPMIAYLADGHGASQQSNWENATTSFISSNFLDIFYKHLSRLTENTDNVINNNNAIANYVIHLVHDIEWKISTHSLQKKTSAYPIADGWLEKESLENITNQILNIFIFSEIRTQYENLIKAMDLGPSHNSIFPKIQQFLLSSAINEKITKESLIDLFINFYRHLLKAGTDDEKLLTAVKNCCEHKSFDHLDSFFEEKLKDLNGAQFNILIKNIASIMSSLDLNFSKNNEFNEIYNLIMDSEKNPNSAIKLAHKLVLLNQKNSFEDKAKIEIEKGAHLFREAASNLFKNFSSITNSSTINTMATKIGVDRKNAVQVILQDILQNIFNLPAKQSMDELKAIVQKYNLTTVKLLAFSSKPTVNLSSPTIEPENKNKEVTQETKGFQS